MALTDNLISYWKLDESSGNASDSVGSNTLTNTNVTYGTGKINNGAVFNAEADKLECADSASLSITGALTINTWAKINSLPANAKYVVFGNKWNGTNVRSYQFLLYNNGGTQTIFAETSANGSSSVSSSYAYSPDTNWHMYTMVYTPSTSVKVYIDSNLVYTNTTSIPASLYNSTASFQLGSDGNGSTDTIIDESGIWSRALTSTEITTLYNSGSGLQYPWAIATTGIKSIDGLAYASIKSIDGVAIASVKSFDGLA